MIHKKPIMIAGILLILSIVLAISGCTGSMVTATPTPAPTATATQLPTPPAIPTVVPTATPAPTATPVPTPVATPAPTPTPAPLATPYTLWPYYEYHWSITPTPQPTYDDTFVQLTINGSASHPLSLTLADLKAYPQYSASMTMSGITVSGTGPLMMDLVDAAGPLEVNDSTMRWYYNGIYATTGQLSYFRDHANFYIIAIDSNNNLEIISNGYVGTESERARNLTAITVVLPPI